MKTEELKAQGLTEEQISFVMAENGKDLKKLQKENDNLSVDRDTWKEKAEAAETTLKGFEGVDLETMQRNYLTGNKRQQMQKRMPRNSFMNVISRMRLRQNLKVLNFPARQLNVQLWQK